MVKSKFQEISAETDIALPPPLITKQVKDYGWISVILVVGKMVESNWLYSNEEQAESRYIDTIREYSFNKLTDEQISKYIKDRFAILEKCQVFIDRPIIN